jgi:hypothetical protein
MVVGAETFAEGDKRLLFNDGFAFDAQSFAAPAKPAANGLLLFGIIIVACKMLAKIPGGVPGRCLRFDCNHDFSFGMVSPQPAGEKWDVKNLKMKCGKKLKGDVI